MSFHTKAVRVSGTIALCLLSGCYNRASLTYPAASSPASLTQPGITDFAAEPTTITTGQLSYLRWTAEGARDINVDGSVGPVHPQGRRAVSPTSTTTYTLTASNLAGATSASVTITVTRPLPPAELPEGRSNTLFESLLTQLRDIHFDNKDEIVEEDQSVLEDDAALLKQLFEVSSKSPGIVIEGHSDQVASAEYAVARGDYPASIVKDSLVGHGLPAEKIQVVSYGREQSLCEDATERCAAQNRRVHISSVR